MLYVRQFSDIVSSWDNTNEQKQICVKTVWGNIRSLVPYLGVEITASKQTRCGTLCSSQVAQRWFGRTVSFLFIPFLKYTIHTLLEYFLVVKGIGSGNILSILDDVGTCHSRSSSVWQIPWSSEKAWQDIGIFDCQDAGIAGSHLHEMKEWSISWSSVCNHRDRAADLVCQHHLNKSGL